MKRLNVWATVLALGAGFLATAAVGTSPKVSAEIGDAPVFIMSGLFGAVLLWIPARLILGFAGKLTEKTDG